MSKMELGPDISRITDYLYISAWPEAEHVDEILALNIRLILSMHWVKPAKSLNQPPLRVLWLPTIDTPLTKMPMGTLRRGVEAALPVIEAGGVFSPTARLACIAAWPWPVAC